MELMNKEPNGKKGKYTQNLRFIGTIIAILFWWYDAYIDTYIFLDGEFVDNMFRPEPKKDMDALYCYGLSHRA